MGISGGSSKEKNEQGRPGEEMPRYWKCRFWGSGCFRFGQLSLDDNVCSVGFTQVLQMNHTSFAQRVWNCRHFGQM